MFGHWNPASRNPPILGDSYLVMLCEGNALEWTHEYAVTAFYGYGVSGTEFDKWSQYWDWGQKMIDITDDVLWWMPLPKPPDELRHHKFVVGQSLKPLPSSSSKLLAKQQKSS